MWLQLVAAVLALAIASPDQPQLTFEDYYRSGKIAYTEQDWQSCIAFMRRTIEDFKYLEDELLFCRKKCQQQVEEPELSPISQYHFEAEKALCFLRCKRERLTELHPGIKKMDTYFDVKERKAFEYLHICHWNAREVQKATGAAFTFLVANPGHPDVLHALNFYMGLKEFREDWLVDEWALKHEKYFMGGVLAYREEDWSRCSNDLEMALERVLDEEVVCRLQCEDKIDWSGVDGNPEVSVVATSIRASIVRCAHNCLPRLGVINGHSFGNPIAAVFEYLHVCYFKQMRGSDAMRAVGGYLLFEVNPTMRRNKHFYSEHYRTGDLFTPDKNLLEFHRQRTVEKRFLDFVENRIRYENNEFPPEVPDDRKRLSLAVWQGDDFDYASVGSFLSQAECKLLRAPLPTPTTELLLKELTERAKRLFPSIEKTGTSGCGPARETDCDRPFVLSADTDRCSEWMGRQFSGCSVVFCV